MGEFDLIGRLQEIIDTPRGEDSPEVVVGIGDDGAVLDIPPGIQLVVSTDTLVEGVHFPVKTGASDVGYKSLAVSLSDLAAMGAAPAWFFLSLTLPSDNQDWLDSFAAGISEIAVETRTVLAGGDTTGGPLSITITALGLLEAGTALTRCGARAGDLIAVSGYLGTAARVLENLNSGVEADQLERQALDRPFPRLELGRRLRGLATACIDISDGLFADLGHMLQASGVGAELELDLLPFSQVLNGLEEEKRWLLQLTGGDDYELCFTLPESSAGALKILAEELAVPVRVVGQITPKPGLNCRRNDGSRWDPGKRGFDHFDSDNLS